MSVLAVVLTVLIALGVLLVVGVALGLRYLINLPVGPAGPPGKPAPGVDAAEVQRALDEAVRMTSGRLPPGVQGKVSEIRRQVLELLPATGAFPLGSEDVYIIQRTATDYLPSTLRAYLALPQGEWTERAQAGGKSALQLLEEQLQVLDERLDEISEAVHRQDLDRLVANGRFLEERFGGNTGGLQLPPGERPAGSSGEPDRD